MAEVENTLSKKLYCLEPRAFVSCTQRFLAFSVVLSVRLPAELHLLLSAKIKWRPVDSVTRLGAKAPNRCSKFEGRRKEI